MALRISLGQHSDAGPRPVNQDFHGAVLATGALLAGKGIAVALADGIASSAVSQEASAAAVRGFLDDYYATSDTWPVRRAAQRVLQALNAWLHAQTLLGEGRFDQDRGHVCTFSALVLKGREAHLLHVGDCRVLRLQPRALEPMSEDHRVRVSASESYLARALGTGPSVEIDYRRWPLDEGEVYLLATDGAWEHLDAAAVHAALLAHPEDLQAAAERLVATALARGSDDNTTVQLLRIEALPEPEAHQLRQQREGLALPPPLQPGQAFEGCTLVRELHASARSQVFLATDDASGRPLVIKVPATELRGDEAALDRLALEQWVAQRLPASPHLLRAADLGGRRRRHLFVALDFVDGQTLDQWMTDHPRPELDAVRALVAQVARGLQALHRQALIHQDLRPANVMIDRAGTALLIDYGATHVAGLAEGTAAADTAELLGSLQYTAPEYFSGEGGGAASDLFSLAVVAYQMLSGQLPYGLQVTQVRSPADLHRLAYVPIRSHRPDLPVWLDAVLRRALHPQPARRQGDVLEFAHDLQQPGPQYQGTGRTPLAARHPLVFWRVLSAVLALAVLLLLGLRVAGR